MNSTLQAPVNCVHGSTPIVRGLDLRATLLAWAEAAPSRIALAPSTPKGEKKKLWVRLPGSGRALSAFAREMGDVLSTAEIYSREGLAMRPNHRKNGLEVVSPKVFASWVESHVTLFVATKDGQTVTSITSEDAGRLLASEDFLDRLRQVERINPTRLPVLRASGSLELLSIGYDAESKTLTQSGLDYPVDTNFEDAWEIIAGLVQEFPFAREPVDESGELMSTDRNLAVAVAAMVGVFARGLLPQDSLSPAFLYVANTEGAGKTLLASLALVPVYGVMNIMPPPKDEEKLKQELLALVMSGAAYVVFDNWRGQIASAALEGFITATNYSGRIMRENVTFEGRKEVAVFITGNNCSMNGDMRRRSLMCDLFVEEARSEDRKIVKRMDIPAIQSRRGEILGALWALVKHWDAKGRPACSREHGSFAAWARVIGGIVETSRFGCCIGESRSARSGDLNLQHMVKLCELVLAGEVDEESLPQPGVARGVRRLHFDEVVKIAQANGLFEDKLDGIDDDKGRVAARSAFSKAVKKYDGRIFKGVIRMSIEGNGNARRYVFKRLEAL